MWVKLAREIFFYSSDTTEFGSIVFQRGLGLYWVSTAKLLSSPCKVTWPAATEATSTSPSSGESIRRFPYPSRLATHFGCDSIDICDN